MKTLKFLIFALFLLGNVGIAVAQDDPRTMAVPDGKAIIYIIRTFDTYGMFRSVNKIDGTELPTLGSRDYVYKVVDPGENKVNSKGSTKESELTVKTEAGKKYYVLQQVSVMFYSVYWAKLSLIKDEKRAQKTLSGCTEAKFKDAK
jgi:hypothetical protein